LFEQYVKRDIKRAYFFAHAFFGNHDDAMEISQQAIFRAYR